MEKKRNIFDADVMALPPLRLVIGDIPSPDPDRRKKPNQLLRQSNHEVEGAVKRIIARLEED
jgi:hypothetical protein